MSELLETLQAVLLRARAVWLGPQVLGSALTAVLVAGIGVRLRFGPGAWRRLLSGEGRTDATYSVFYLGGIYAFLVSGPAYRFLSQVVEEHAPFLQLRLLGHLPVLAQFFVASVVMDGVLYWTHRWMHGSPLLWAFHSVHHSSRELTPLANFRFHVIDVFVRGLAQFVPGLLLGVPLYVWLPTVWIQVGLDCLAHSGLGWSYGPLGRVLVSPRFHRVHHSMEPAHSGRNFGMTYSFWDRLFGTADEEARAPSGYGLAGVDPPESFVRQLAFPFLLLAGEVGSGARAAEGASSSGAVTEER